MCTIFYNYIITFTSALCFFHMNTYYYLGLTFNLKNSLEYFFKTGLLAFN